MKTCTTCKEEKLKTEFCKNKRVKDGFDRYCKKCCLKRYRDYKNKNNEKVLAYGKKHYAANSEKILAAHKKYRDENKEKIKNYHKNYYKNHIDKYANYQKEYCKKNPEKVAAKLKKWEILNREKRREQKKKYYKLNKLAITIRNKKYHRNPEKQLAKTHKRRALLRSSEGTYSILDIKNLMILQEYKCVYCQKELILVGKGKYHVDHYVPLFLRGSNYPDNLQLLCPKCNLSKGAKHPDEYEKNIGYIKIKKENK